MCPCPRFAASEAAPGGQRSRHTRQRPSWGVQVGPGGSKKGRGGSKEGSEVEHGLGGFVYADFVFTQSSK